MSAIDNLGGGSPAGGVSALDRLGARPSSTSSNPSGQFDLNSPDGLLSLAQQQGGSISSAANELVHPTTGILSTIGSGFKNAFKDFVDIISTPSQVVAGTLNSFKTGSNVFSSVGDAIKNNISPADVIWGKEDPNGNGMQKVGGFLTRTATNVLLDPLTYLTFGAGEGFLGLRATSEISLGTRGAEAVGKTAGDVASLSGAGQKIYSALKGIERQVTGTTATDIIKTGDKTLDLAGEELQNLLKASVDSPLNPDFARVAIGNMIEKNPGLASDLIDKGGVKFFGQSILSGQRISATMKVIPGMTMLDDITKSTRMGLLAPFDTSLIHDGQKWTRLPPEYLDTVQNLKDVSTQWADKSVGDIANIIKANGLSIPEAKFLTAAVEAGYKPADERLANAWGQFFNLGQDQYKMMKDAGIPVSYLNRYVPHMLVKEKTLSSLPFKLPPSTEVGAAIHRTLEGPIFDLKPDQLAAFEQKLTSGAEGAGKHVEELLNQHVNEGFQIFDKNIASAWVGRSVDNVRGTTARYFMQNIAQHFGVPEDVGRTMGYVPIDSKGIKNASEEFVQRVFGEEGKQMLYHPAIAKHIEEFVGSTINDAAMGQIGKNFDKLQNFWKASVTSYFPSFHGRNAISNVLQNFLDIGVHALNPMLHFQAGSLINDNRVAEGLRTSMFSSDAAVATKATEDYNNLMGKTIFTDTTGHDWSFGELSSVVKSHNIAFTSRITSSADIAKGPGQIEKTLFDAPGVIGAAKKVGNAIKDSGPVVGNAVESQARLVNFMANLRGTGDVMLAAKRTKQFLFDYNNLTNFERTVMKRMIPFYTYTRKNLELQASALIHTPGRISAEVQGLQTLGETISGGQQLNDKEYAALPDWMKSGIGILAKKNGEIVTMLSSLGTPIEQPFQAIQANQFLGGLSPLIRLPLEQMAGYSLYQGKPLSEVTNATAFVHAPKALQDFIGFTTINAKRSDGTPFTMYVALHPERMNLVLNLPPFTRVFGALKQMQAVDVTSQQKILQQLIGVKPYSFDLQQEAQKRQNEMKTKLQQLLTSANVTAQFKTTYIPKAKVGK